MQKKTWPLSLSLLAVFAILSAALTSCYRDGTTAAGAATTSITDSRTFAVAAGKTMTFFVRLEPKDTVEASFTIQGGDGDIDFSVKDPINTLVVEKKRATNMGAFAFFANATGYHQVVFDNTFSTTANKIIWLKISHPGRGGLVP